MSPRVVLRPVAVADLDDHADYLEGRRRGTGARFYAAADASVRRLAERPGLGERYEVAVPRLDGLRCWAIPRFRNHLFFYLPIEGGIEVIRVLHGARDIDRLLASDDEG